MALKFQSPITFQEEQPLTSFVPDAQKELGYYIVTGELLKRILNGKRELTYIRTQLEHRINWTILNATKAATYRKLLTVMMEGTTRTNNLIQRWVLPFYQPEKRSEKEIKVRGYTLEYIDTQNKTLLLLSDLKGTHMTKQRVLAFQRVINHYAIYFTLAEYLNGITPDREFVIPTKDKVYVLPAPQLGDRQFGFGTMPTSAGATSQTYQVQKPQGGPYKQQMSSRIE